MKAATKFLVFGVAVSACIGGAAFPASATTTEDGETISVSDATTINELEVRKASTTLKVRANIKLGPGKEVESSKRMLKFEQRVFDGKPLGMDLEWNASMMDWDGLTDTVSAAAAYPLSLDGEKTDYWLKTRVYTLFDKLFAYGECEIFQGMPGTEGAKPTWSSPFQCETRKGWFNDFDLMVSLQSLAEATGTITSQDVDLTDGTFRTDVGYHHAGATELTSGQSTRFDALLREGDTPFYNNQARTEWAYQITDQGAATGRWVAGLSTNFHGTMGHSADKRCAVYANNPLENGDRLDDHTPFEDPDYTCTATGEALDGIGGVDNPRFDATFTIKRK